MCVCVLVAQFCQSLRPHELIAQAALSMGFSRQEHWSGSPCPSPGHLPDPGIEPMSPRFFALGATRKALTCGHGAHIFEKAVFMYSSPMIIRDFPLIHLSIKWHCNIPCDTFFCFPNTREKRKQMKWGYLYKAHWMILKELLFLFNRWGNWAPERINKVSNLLWLASDKT